MIIHPCCCRPSCLAQSNSCWAMCWTHACPTVASSVLQQEMAPSPRAQTRPTRLVAALSYQNHSPIWQVGSLPFRPLLSHLQDRLFFLLALPSYLTHLHPVFHVSLLEPYKDPSEFHIHADPKPFELADDPALSIDKILDSRCVGHHFEYFVHFVHFLILKTHGYLYQTFLIFTMSL